MIFSSNRGEINQKVQLLIKSLTNLHDTTGKFLLHLPDGRIIDTKSWNTDTWEWTHGIGLYGLYQYSSYTQNPNDRTPLSSWWEARNASGISVEKNINTMSPFLSLACLYEDDPSSNASFLPVLEEWAKWAMEELHRTRYGGMQHDTYLGPNIQQLWDDTLMMTVMPLTKIGILLQRRDYIEEAKNQFLLHIEYLFDRETGAFFHGWTFDGNHNFARARWARGNSWLTIVIPEFVELLDDVEDGMGGWHHQPLNAVRTHLLSVFEAQVLYLAKVQDVTTGLWHTLLDCNDEASYLESSATAGFAYGMLKSLRKGYLSHKLGAFDQARGAASQAVTAVLSCIDGEGELRRTSFGTGMGDSLDFYRKIPVTSMPYGQAMAIMALTEALKA